MGREEVHKGFWWGNLKERDHLEDPSVNERIILRWIFKKRDGDEGLDLSDSGEGEVVGTCKLVMKLRVP
jgi:hypothetical protein